VPITGDKIAIKWLFAPYVILMIALTVRYTFIVIDSYGAQRKTALNQNKTEANT